MVNKAKGFSSQVLYIIFLCLCFPVLLLTGCKPIEIGQPGAMEEADLPVKKSGQILRDEVWSELIIVEEDVTVPAGSTLTIDNGTKVKFKKGTKMIVHGSLYAEGHVNHAISMTSAETKPESGDWDGIVFSETSLNSKMEFCVVNFHKQIVCLSDSLRINDCVITGGSIAGILCDSTSPIIEDNMITKNELGIRCERSASPTINHNNITSNETDGIECKEASFPRITNNVIRNNLRHGIACYSASSPEITSNNITHNGGWAVYDGGKMISNFIQGNNQQDMNSVETSTSPYGDQYYGVERVESPRSYPIEEAGVRKKDRW